VARTQVEADNEPTQIDRNRPDDFLREGDGQIAGAEVHQVDPQRMPVHKQHGASDRDTSAARGFFEAL
jgi:hypothetical protein